MLQAVKHFCRIFVLASLGILTWVVIILWRVTA